ncbi:MAG: nitroreductase family protein [Phycisphaerales bacterium]
MDDEHRMIPFSPHEPQMSPEQVSEAFYRVANLRRTVRQFSDRPVSRETIENIILAAGTAPSGAHKQPWRFIAISNPEMKKKVRVEIEKVETEFYEKKASDRWLDDLTEFETSPDKSYMDTVPWIIVVMALRKTDDGGQVYYLNESVGLAAGLLLTAANEAGLSTVTQTPSPMGFLRELLGRPEHERPYMVIPVGYAADDCVVPDLERKSLGEISVFEV